MWGGFYSNGENGVFIQMSVFQVLITLLSVAFYSIRKHRIALKLIPSSANILNHAVVAKRAAVAGSFGIASVNLIVGLILYFINGNIDIWVTGTAI